MAKPKTLKFGKMRVKIGDSGSPEEFDFPCGFTTKALNMSKTLQEINVPDCDDPDAPAWVERDVQSIDWSITGEGVLAQESLQIWDAWAISVEPKNVLVELEFTDETVTYTGSAHLESLTKGSDQGSRVTLGVSIQGNGELVRAPVASG